MPKETVICSKCKTSRVINRQYLTRSNASFWCSICRKEVAPLINSGNSKK